ncbi:MAG: spore protease YyaC [Candidatus Pristimantibacillus sp.]
MKIMMDANGDNLNEFLSSIALLYPNRNSITFLCIGTDRSTGDCFGPLVGTMLEEQGWTQVIGTMKQPCDAYKVTDAVRDIMDRDIVIAIDACLGKPQMVGQYRTLDGPLKPGQATGANLPAVGQYSIAGIVNAISVKPYMTIQTTSLYHVMQMAATVARAVELAWSRQTPNKKEHEPDE